MFQLKKESSKEEARIMRIYKPCADGFVNRGSGIYEKKSIIPTQPFPLGTFVSRCDYALENPDGTLSWLQAARLYKGKEYAEFSGVSNFEKKGEVIWRK